MAAGSLEARLSNLEELVIIIIIIIYGGGRGGGGVGDPAATDTARLQSLMNLVRRPHGDPFVTDISRMSVEAIESRLLEVGAEVTRLRSQEGELNARLKELRGGAPKAK